MIRRPFAVPVGDRRILGETLIPAGPPPRTGVLLVHGFRAFHEWGFFPWLAGELAARRHMVARFSFTGSGVASGSEDFTELDRLASNTLTSEVEELHQVIAASRRGDVFPRPPRTLYLVGHGRGGGVALVAAAENEAVSRLVTWSCPARFDRWRPETVDEWRENGRIYVLDQRTGRQLPLDLTFLEDFERARDRLDLVARAETLGAPWLIVHGTDDLTVPPEDARSLAASGPSARLVLVEGVGHTYGVRHPMGVPTAGLEQALAATAAHLPAD